jgi:hypothetical protein
MLKNHTQILPNALRLTAKFMTKNIDRSLINRDQGGEYLKECGFTAAIWAKKPKDFPL